MNNFLFDIFIYCDNEKYYDDILNKLEKQFPLFNFTQIKTNRLKKGFVIIEGSKTIDFLQNIVDNNFICFVKKDIYKNALKKLNCNNILKFNELNQAINKILMELNRLKPIESIEFDLDKLKKDIKNKFLFVKNNYINRSEEEKVKKLIKKQEDITVISIKGLGGVGKTYLIGKIINDLIDEYNFFVFEVLNESKLNEILYESMFKYIKKINGVSHFERSIVLNNYAKLIIDNLHLSNAKNIYIVIDSAERNKKISFALIDLFKKYPIILTSREILEESHKIIRLYGMNKGEAEDLLKSLNEKLFYELKKANKLYYFLDKIDYIPLAINLIAGFKDAEQLEAIFENILINDSIREKVEKIFKYNYDKLDKKTKDTLHSIAIIPNIKKEDIKKIINKTEIFKNKISQNEIDNSIKKLIDIHFIKEINEKYYIHPLLREYIMSLLSRQIYEEKATIKYQVLKILLEFYSDYNEKEKFILDHLEDIEEVVYKVSIKRAREIVYEIADILYKNGYFFLLTKFYEKIDDILELAYMQIRINKIEGIYNLYEHLTKKEINQYHKEFYTCIFLGSIYEHLNIELLEQIFKYSMYKLNDLFYRNEQFDFKLYYSLLEDILYELGIRSGEYYQSKLLMETYNLTSQSNFLLGIYNILILNLHKKKNEILEFIRFLLEDIKLNLEDREIDFYKLKAICEIILNKKYDKTLKKIKELEEKRGEFTTSKFIGDFDKFKQEDVKNIKVERLDIHSLFYKIVLALQGDLNKEIEEKTKNIYELLIIKSIKKKNKKYIKNIGFIEEVLLNIYAKDWIEEEDKEIRELNSKKDNFLKKFIEPKRVSYPFNKEELFVKNNSGENISKEKILKKMEKILNIKIEFYSYHMLLSKNDFEKKPVNNIELEALIKSLINNNINELIDLISKSSTFKYVEEKQILYDYLKENNNKKIIEKLRNEKNKHNEFERNLFLATNSEYIVNENNFWFIKYSKLHNKEGNKTNIEEFEKELIKRCYDEFKKNKIKRF